MNHSETIQKNFTNMLELDQPFEWELAACSFFIGKSVVYKTNEEGRELFIESRQHPDGSIYWVVKMEIWVLNRTSFFEWEPKPSFKSVKFIDRIRWKTKEDALFELLEHERKNSGKFIGLTVPKNAI